MNIMVKSPNDVEPAGKLEQQLTASMENLSALEQVMELMVKKRENLGEYNTDSADILALAQTLLALIRELK